MYKTVHELVWKKGTLGIAPLLVLVLMCIVATVILINLRPSSRQQKGD